MTVTPTSIADVRARLQSVLLSIDNTLYSGGLSTHRYNDADNDSALGTTPRSSIRTEEDVSYYTPLARPRAVRPAAPAAATSGHVGHVTRAPPPQDAASRTADPAPGGADHDEGTSPNRRVTFSVPPPLRQAPVARPSDELRTTPSCAAMPLTVAQLSTAREAEQSGREAAVAASGVLEGTSPRTRSAAAVTPTGEGVRGREIPRETPTPRLTPPPPAAAPVPIVVQRSRETPPPSLPASSLSERLSLLQEDMAPAPRPKTSAAWRPTVAVQEPERFTTLRRPVPAPQSEEGQSYSGTLRYTDPTRLEINVDKHLHYQDGSDTIDDAFQSLQHHFAATSALGPHLRRYDHSVVDDDDEARAPLRTREEEEEEEEDQRRRRQRTAAVDRSSDFVKSPPRPTLSVPPRWATAAQSEANEAEYMLSVLRQRRASDEAQLRESRQVPPTRRPAPSPPRRFSCSILPSGGHPSDYALTTVGGHRPVSPHTAHDDLVLRADRSQLRDGPAVAAAATGDAERVMRRRIAEQHEQQTQRRDETSRSRAAAEEEMLSLYREAQAMRDRQDRLREGGLLTRGEALQRDVAAECAVRPPSPAELSSIRAHAYELERLRALYEGRIAERTVLPDATVLETQVEPSPLDESLEIPAPQPAIVQRRTPVLPATAADKESTPERVRPLKRKARKQQPPPVPSDESDESEEVEEEEEGDEESENQSLSDSTVGGAPRADEHTHLPQQPATAPRPVPVPAVIPAPEVIVAETPSPSPRGSPSVVPLLPIDDSGARGRTPNSLASSVRSERLHVSPTRHGRFTAGDSRDRNGSDEDDKSETIWADGDDDDDALATRARKSGAAKNLYGGRPGGTPSVRGGGGSSNSPSKRPFATTRSRADPEKVASHAAVQAAMAEVTMLQAVNKLKQKGVAVDVKLAGRRIPARLTLSADETELLFEVERLVPKAAPPPPPQQQQMPPRPQSVPPRKMMPPPPQMMPMGGRPGPYPSPQRVVRPPQDLIRAKGLPPGVQPVPLPAGMTPLLQHNIPIVHNNQVSWLSAHDPRIRRTLPPPPPQGPSVTRTNWPSTAASSRRRSAGAGGPSPQPQPQPAAAAAKIETVKVRESHHFPLRNARAYMPFAVMGNERELGDGGPHTWEDVGGVLCGPAACELLRCYRCTLFAEMRAPSYCSYRVFVLVPETQRGERPREAVLLVLDFRSRVDLITFLLAFQQAKDGPPLTYGRVLWLLATQRLQRARSFLGLNPFDMEYIARGVPVPLGGRSPTASRAPSPALSRDTSAVLGYRSGSPLNKAKTKIKNLFSLRRHGESVSPRRSQQTAAARKDTGKAPPLLRREEPDETELAREVEEEQVRHAYEEKAHKSSSSRFGLLRRFSRSISGGRSSHKEQSSQLAEANANTSTSKRKTGDRFVLPG